MSQIQTSPPEFSAYGFTCEQWEPARMQRPDRHNEIELNLLMAGSLTYLLGGRRTTIEAGKLAIFWGAIPHQIVEFDGNAPYFVVTVPLIEFLRMGLDQSVVNPILLGTVLTDSKGNDLDDSRFRQWERELRGQDLACKRATRLEVQARLLRFASGTSNAPDHHSIQLLSNADQLACYIARNYQEPLTSKSIAESIGVHPNYAMNLFRQTFGTTMTTFITQHRISHAQRLLVTTSEAILDIALESGFQSLSRFNEAFKATCGCSPRDYRKSHKAKPA
ncbi:helix-turn-helix domain-containing protein [Rubripirellula lacrimiformis]|nr:helix-turn-helix domain-containing protein [Rubripirellula lacrimiformis]